MRRARGGGSRGAINRCAINRIARAGCTAPFRGISGALAPLHRSCGAMGRIPSAHGTDCRRECTGCWATATGALRRMHRPCRANQPVHCAECTEAIAPMSGVLRSMRRPCRANHPVHCAECTEPIAPIAGAFRRIHRRHRADQPALLQPGVPIRRGNPRVGGYDACICGGHGGYRSHRLAQEPEFRLPDRGCELSMSLAVCNKVH